MNNDLDNAINEMITEAELALGVQRERRLSNAVEVAVRWGYGGGEALALALQMEEAFCG